MKSILGLVFVAAFLAGPMAFADDIFVREAHGVGLSKAQTEEITHLVERAVQRMPNQRLVASEDLADFILEPSITTRDGRLALRIDKVRNGEIVASSLEPLPGARLNARHARTAIENAITADETVSGTTSPAGTTEEDTATHHEGRDRHTSTHADTGAGDVRAPSPIFHHPGRHGAFQVGIGPAFSTGMASDQLLYNVNLAYAHPVHNLISLKAFGDFNMSASSDPNRFLNFGVGADVFPMGSHSVGGGRPYLTGDVGYAFIKNKNDASKDAPAVGLGGGYKFATEKLNMDVNLHYTMLTAELQNETPSVLGLRAAVNF